MKPVRIDEAKEKQCPFLEMKCKADCCMSWETTIFTEQVDIGYESVKYGGNKKKCIFRNK